jgi:hypothetical protein
MRRDVKLSSKRTRIGFRGSVASWQNHLFPGTTSFVVELPAGSLTGREARNYADAVAALAG